MNKPLILSAKFSASKGINVPANAIVQSKGFKAQVKAMRRFFKKKRNK